MSLKRRGVPYCGADSPRQVRLIGLDLRNALGVPRQRRLMCRHHDSRRERRGLIGFVIHESQAATPAGTATDSTCGTGPDGVWQPRSRFAAMNERQEWMQRLEEFVVYLRDELQREPTTWQQHESIVTRWIDFALPLGQDPAQFDEVLIGQLLDRQRDLSDSSRAGYTSNLRGWCRWASNESTAVGHDSAGHREPLDDIAMWMARLEEYLSYLRHRGRGKSTIKKRRGRLSKWVRFACSTGRNPAAWDPSAVEEAFVVWGTVESPRQRDYISRRIQVWCQYWRDSGLASLTLDDLVQQFREEGYPDHHEGYPDHHAAQHLAARTEYEAMLRSLPDLTYERRDELRNAWKRASNGYDYGGVGVTAGLDGAVRDVSETDWPQMRDGIYALCYGDGDLTTRFDETVASIKGLGQLMATRFLAIAHPQRFLPNFLTHSSNSQWPGKLDAIELLVRLDLLDATAAAEAQALLESPKRAMWSGDLTVRSNDLLLEVLRPHFSDGGSDEGIVDTWGMSQFGYWLAERYVDDDADLEDDGDDDDDENVSARERLAVALADAASDLFCGVDFLNDIVELLEDKGQVILYGPPGTGKTYFAQRLAQALTGNSSAVESVDEGWTQRLDAYCLHLEQDQKVQAGTHRSIARRWIEFALERELDPSAWDESLYLEFADLNPDWQEITRKTHRYDLLRWCSWASSREDSREGGTFSLVQFHPAYSYEDFFEGFRPAVDEDGNMTYQLTPGPLMKIAEIARGNPDQRHVMVIDEINRANLPRVLGELLFLLEYRKRAISTQYGPDTPFSLPENLWFIGTMNTADRSIALIDAAMRRRFHFVPFFPNRPPTQGLLRSWTQKRAPNQAPIADLLERVNGELEQALGGDHLLIGPSHFMKRNLDTEGLRRIWVYNIEPLIEDQLFGQQEVISRFRFDAVWKRHGPAATSSGAEPEVTDEPAGDAVQPSNEGVHVEGQDGA